MFNTSLALKFIYIILNVLHMESVNMASTILSQDSTCMNVNVHVQTLHLYLKHYYTFCPRTLVNHSHTNTFSSSTGDLAHSRFLSPLTFCSYESKYSCFLLRIDETCVFPIPNLSANFLVEDPVLALISSTFCLMDNSVRFRVGVAIVAHKLLCVLITTTVY